MSTFHPLVSWLFRAGLPVALLLLVCINAFALKLHVEVTPSGLQASGFSIKVEPRDNGRIEFTLTRDLSKARSFGPDSELELRRSGTLEVFSKSGFVARCEAAPTKQKNTLTYRFAIARECVPYSTFTLAEIDDYKNVEGREHLLGGGTFYQFRLADFAEHAPAQ